MRRGLSLLEAVLGMTLLMLVIMAVLELFPSTSFATHRTAQEITATSLASSLLESARSGSFGALQVGSTQTDSTTIDGMRYNSSLAIFAVSGENVAYLKGLRVTVAWTDKGIAHQLTQESWVAKIPR